MKSEGRKEFMWEEGKGGRQDLTFKLLTTVGTFMYIS
jgi:hypothetical protein